MASEWESAKRTLSSRDWSARIRQVSILSSGTRERCLRMLGLPT